MCAQHFDVYYIKCVPFLLHLNKMVRNKTSFTGLYMNFLQKAIILGGIRYLDSAVKIVI